MDIRHINHKEGQFAMDIWHVNNKEGHSLRLWRRSDGKFQVVEDGNYSSVLGNGNYILIARRYLPAFEGLDDQVTFKDAVVIDCQFESEVNDYLEMDIRNKIDTESIGSMDSSGLKIWCYEGSVFVSGALKKKMVAASKDELCFSQGFSFFG